MAYTPADQTLLAERIEFLRRFFDLKRLIRRRVDPQSVRDHYIRIRTVYELVQPEAGSAHLALNFDGRYSLDGHYTHARMVHEHINEIQAGQVLELASGKGFNTLYLAERNRQVAFAGIELTPLHGELAQQQARSRSLGNVSFRIGDFQTLPFEAQQFDLLFVIEGLCHATDMRQALSEAWRVLKPGGRFIVFDGFRSDNFAQFDDIVKLAVLLAERSMAVGDTWELGAWLNAARNVGFEVMQTQDVSEGVQPHLREFERLAQRCYATPLLNYLVVQALPRDLVQNMIAGFLLPLVVKSGAQGYHIVVLERSAATIE